MALTEYQTGTTFPGIIGRTPAESSPGVAGAQSGRPRAPRMCCSSSSTTWASAHLGCYGSPIATPNIDALAADGLLYTNMHTTALCSPSRSCIINGRNHHSNHLACLTNGSTGYPGLRRLHPVRERVPLRDPARQQGYNTYCVGKWHLAPEETMTAAGPYDRWPLGRGFERYYGFLGGDTHQYYPELVRDNSQTEPETHARAGLPPDPRSGGEGQGDDRRRQAGRAGQAVLPVLRPRRDALATPRAQGVGRQVRRQVRQGLGVSTASEVFEQQKKLGIWCPPTRSCPATIPMSQDWDSLSADERRLYARMMEVFAGFLEHTDHYLGELIAVPQGSRRVRQHADHADLRQRFQRRRADRPARSTSAGSSTTSPDTVEDGLAHIDEIGGPTVFNHFPWGWTNAGNTPFRRWKRETYRGGVTDPFIVCWPRGHHGPRRDARRSTPTSSTWCRPCSTRWTSSRPRPSPG